MGAQYAHAIAPHDRHAAATVGLFDGWVASATLHPMTLDEIKQAIANLSPQELAQLRVWLAQFEAGRSDREAASEPNPEPETTASKLGWLTGRAIADFRKRIRDT